ncbi:MAG: SCP2 sterol-binding domain-containing protein [Acidobacteriaceae bacterium]
MAEMKPYMERIQSKLEEAGALSLYKGLTATFGFTFTDLNQSYSFSIVDGTARPYQASRPEKLDAEVITTSEVYAGIMDKKINPMAAYSTRKLQTRGNTEILMRLQRVIV